MRKNERGFGVVEILLVIVVIGLLAAVGWLFFDKQKDKNNDEINTTTKSKQIEQKEESTATQDTPAKATSSLTVTPTLGTSSIVVKAPEGWSTSGDSGSISKTIDGQEYIIQFIIAADSHAGNSYRSYAHFTDDYASNDNTTLKTISTGSVETYLVKSVAMSDVVLRTCKALADTTCYPKHEGLPLIVRLFNNVPGAQSYTGLKDFSSASTTTAISDFETIAKSVKN